MSNRPRRRQRKARTRMDVEYERAAVEILRTLDGRAHPIDYTAPQLRQIVVADIVGGWHSASPPHLWFMARSVTLIAAKERKDRDTVTEELLAAAENIRPGATVA